MCVWRKKSPKKMATNKGEKVLFRQDNALCHKSIITNAKLHELHLNLLSYPPYSPDLAPSDYWLFADLKKILQGRNLAPLRLKTNGSTKKSHRIVRETLESVYHPRRWLCWWIKSNFAQVFVLLVRPSTYWVMCYNNIPVLPEVPVV